jgi:hypothetical protein
MTDRDGRKDEEARVRRRARKAAPRIESAKMNEGSGRPTTSFTLIETLASLS